MNRKLQEIGNKLNVSKQDVESIQKERIKGMFIYPIIGAVIAACSIILGFLLGVANPVCVNCEGYPYGAAGVASAAVSWKKKKSLLIITAIITALLSFVGFVTAYKTAQNMFGYAIMYNVYKK